MKVCSICAHEHWQRIDLLLVRGDISNQRAAQQFGVTEQEVQFHRCECLPRLLEKARVLQAFITLFFESKSSQREQNARTLQQDSAEYPIQREPNTSKLARKTMKADEVAELLCVTQARVYELVRQKLIPHFRVGIRQNRFLLKAILEWRDKGGSKGSR